MQSITVMYWLGGFLIVVLVIPNTTNFKERRAFSDSRRLEEAMTLYHADRVGDSVDVIPGPYYKRGKVGMLFLGKKQRDLWTTPVRAKVFDYGTAKGGLTPEEFGGGDQTISLKLKDPQGKGWALRSVNKDQKFALPKALQITFMRFLYRDQLASANPYGQLVLPVLANAIGLHHTTPELVLIPYNEKFGQFNQRMAGRLAYLEENLNSSWKNRKRFGSPKDIVNTEEMMEMVAKEKISVDTALYLKTRLFDMLISDWDRHEGNWEWALTTDNGDKVFEPIPKDRDAAFYQFDEGLVSHFTLMLAPKLQSFRREFGKVSGLMFQSKDLDSKILNSVERNEFLNAAQLIQHALTEEVIDSAFRKYPPRIHSMVADEHADILKTRLEQLPQVAEEFHELLHTK
jgi:hypothetical protein